MKYTVEITNKDIMPDGFLRVQVRFTGVEDPSKIIQDHFDTRDGQDSAWLDLKIATRLKELEGLDTFVETIPIGEYVPIEDPVKKVAEVTARDQYALDYQRFNRLIDFIRQGIITDTNEEFVQIKQKLKDNLKPEYLDFL